MKNMGRWEGGNERRQLGTIDQVEPTEAHAGRRIAGPALSSDSGQPIIRSEDLEKAASACRPTKPLAPVIRIRGTDVLAPYKRERRTIPNTS